MATPPDALPDGSVVAGQNTAFQPLAKHQSTASRQSASDVSLCSWRKMTVADCISSELPSQLQRSRNGHHDLMFRVTISRHCGGCLSAPAPRPWVPVSLMETWVWGAWGVVHDRLSLTTAMDAHAVEPPPPVSRALRGQHGRSKLSGAACCAP